MARFIREIGRCTNADYGKETGIYDRDARKFLRSVFYKNVRGFNYKTERVKEMLSSNKPVYVSATQRRYHSGHIWIIDGYIDEFVRNPQTQKKERLKTYVHSNWGWGG